MSFNLFNCVLNRHLIKPFVPISRVISMTRFELLKKANHTNWAELTRKRF